MVQHISSLSRGVVSVWANGAVGPEELSTAWRSISEMCHGSNVRAVLADYRHAEFDPSLLRAYEFAMCLRDLFATQRHVFIALLSRKTESMTDVADAVVLVAKNRGVRIECYHDDRMAAEDVAAECGGHAAEILANLETIGSPPRRASV